MDPGPQATTGERKNADVYINCVPKPAILGITLDCFPAFAIAWQRLGAAAILLVMGTLLEWGFYPL